MMQSFDDAGKYGQEFIDSGTRSLASLQDGLQSIASAAADYSKKTVESSSAGFEKLAGAKSMEMAIEIQTEFARQAYEGFVGQATRMSGLYAEVAKEAYKPFESIVIKAK